MTEHRPHFVKVLYSNAGLGLIQMGSRPVSLQLSQLGSSLPLSLIRDSEVPFW